MNATAPEPPEADGTPAAESPPNQSAPDVIQVLLAVTVALGATLGTYFTDRATEERQEQARDQMRHDQAIVEIVRQVYQSEAPRVFLHTSACRRAEPSTPAGASEAVRTLLAVDAAAATEAARAWAQASAANDRLLSRCGSGRSYYPIRRLAELSDAELPAAPDAHDPGRVWEVLAVLSALVPVTAALTYLGVLARRRRSGASPHASTELVEQPWAEEGATWFRVGRTAAWTLMTLLPVAQVALSLEASEARATADVLASELYRDLGAGSALTSFRDRSLEHAGFQESVGLGRQFVALDTSFADVAEEHLALGQIEARQGEQMDLLAREMGREPEVGDGLGPAVVEAVGSATASTAEKATEQETAAESAADLETRAGRLSVALLVATLASTLLLVARGSPAQRVRYMRLAGVMLLFSAVFGVTGIVG